MRHSSWVRMRQSGLISDIINNIAEEECGAESTANDDELMAPVQDAEEATVEEAIAEGNKAGEETVAESTEGDNIEGEPVELIEETGGQQPRRSARIAGGIKPPERYAYASFVDKSRWAEESAKDAIRAEVTQLFKDLKALEPVKIEAMVTGACVLTCHMFLVQKYFANGDLDKMKARLVSHGNQQDKEHFPDRSSPSIP